MTTVHPGLEFVLPDELVAREPPEARGLARDQVRLMVSRVGDERITHARFADLAAFLDPGDAVVVNTSATLNAALPALRMTDEGVSDALVHLSTPVAEDRWVIELRHGPRKDRAPLPDARPGERLLLPAGGLARLVEPFVRIGDNASRRVRLWVADLMLPEDVLTYSGRHGSPIGYAYVPEPWPLSCHQTIFADEPGSAEMPSAGRAFTPATLESLARRGVAIAPIVLHAGVASLESDEPPYPERYRVPAPTARAVNRTRAAGRKVLAVGTTTVRALETVASADGRVRAGRGWTDLVIGPARGPLAVDAILTGFHAPRASHLAMLEAFAGRDHLAMAYEEALRERYLWHEFGDLHLIFRKS